MYLSFHAHTFEVQGLVTFEAQSATCNAESLLVIMTDVDFSVNDADNSDHIAYALIDSRGVPFLFVDTSFFNILSPSDLDLLLNPGGMSAGPLLTFEIFDKSAGSLTPGASPDEKYEFAQNNYISIATHELNPVDLGITDCSSITQLYCHDPLIYKSGLEELTCGVDDEPISQFTDSLGVTSFCLSTGSISTGFGDIDYCQGPCGGGTGCEVQVNTSDLVNFTQDKLCSSYTYDLAMADIDSILGGCSLNVFGTYHISASWTGAHPGPFTYGYVTPANEMQWFTLDYTEVTSCPIDPGIFLPSIESLAIETIENFYDTHFINNEGQPFCEIE